MENKMLTRWGKALDREHPLPEYPRPQFRRDSYLNLNGVWWYAFTDTPDIPDEYEDEIVVPFAPEAPLSGEGRTLPREGYLQYYRPFTRPEGFDRGRVLLHFGAVDQEAAVFVNDIEVGRHKGGYIPFTCDITAALREGENELCVTVRDDAHHPSYGTGKQRYVSRGIWYTAQSGIWQTVWLESVPEVYIKSVRITPEYDESRVRLEIAVEGAAEKVTVEVLDGEESLVRCDATEGVATIPLPDFKAWSPDSPFLYGLRLRCGEDRVESYFAMRKFSYVQHGKHRVFALNNEPIFHNGLLDQGYWPDGLMTAPSDEAMIFDVQRCKELGFNVLRKHIKIEPLRWYYHCDRLGMLVWQDMVCGGEVFQPMVTSILPTIGLVKRKDNDYVKFGRSKEEGRQWFLQECWETVEHLYNCPCIALWSPFNEAWGQFDALKVAEELRQRDPTRYIDHASGWHDQGWDEIKSRHIYFRRLNLKNDGRALCLTEFGGYTHAVKGHEWAFKPYGYRKCKTMEVVRADYESLYHYQVLPHIKKRGLTAAIYTQLSDVEQECNGLFTYDREVLKLDETRLKAINAELRF
ncbi:MAG: glycoside hydrolase family 2 [Oscillospiraceae bacterium]|nr:glycoside hydrolase family 2 [Oscillospiraceae bacterium]